MEMRHNIIAALLIALFAAGCGSGGWKDSAVAKDDGIVVRLEQQMKDDKVVDQNYQHPAEIDQFTMSWLLDDLRYIPKPVLIGGSSETQIFQQYEIDRLAPALSEALQMADSGQRVHFTSYNRAVDLIFEKPRKTEGVMFVNSDGTLHIAFSWINVLLDMDGNPQSQRAGRKFDVLTLKDTETRVVAGKPYMRLYRFEDGKTSPMRLVVNTDHLRAGVSREVQQQQTGYQPAPQARPSNAAQAPEPAVEQQQSLRPRQQQATPESAAPVADLETRRKEVRIHLEYLKGLYEEGLITETEYDQQRKQALESLQQK